LKGAVNGSFSGVSTAADDETADVDAAVFRSIAASVSSDELSALGIAGLVGNGG
jgi:hypothetical protein